ncbi:MAG: ATP-binding protein [Pseudoxanthomonas suwonensis]|nr:ATP-binding protein [Pseudoxanthomonas suwonensis]
MPTATLLAWSGGKDAAWALHVLRQGGRHDVVGLLSTVTRDHGRSLMQGVRREVLQAQADAGGLPMLESLIDAGADNRAYEEAFAATLAQARSRWPDIRHIAFGDLLLADIRDWRAALCARLGWQALFPLFGEDTARLARRMVEGGLQAWLCCIDTTLLDARHAGQPFDTALLDALPASVDPCGENGELHTCVGAGPMFRESLALRQGQTALRDGRFAYTDFCLAG